MGCLLLLLLFLTTVARGYVNNFRFKHGNVIKNNILPFTVQLTGTYYVDLLGTPELSHLSKIPLAAAIAAQSLKGDHFPVVCTGQTAGLIAALDDEAHNAFAEKLNTLEKLVNNKTATKGDVIELLQKWGGYIDTSDSQYNCHRLSMRPAPSTNDSFRFTLKVQFDEYKPIVFVDSMGVGMFSYKRSHDTKHSGHSSGRPIRFCGGVDYTGDMYTIEPRPKCPISSSDKARHYGRAVITVYKPNIVSFRWNATRCIQTFTHVQSYENIFGTSRDSWRKHRAVETTKSECEEWNRTLSACNTFMIRGAKEKDKIGWTGSWGTVGFKNSYEYYGSHMDQCKLKPKFSQKTANNEYESTPDLKYQWSGGDTYTSDFRTATLSRGFIEVSMPTGTMVTPWMNIPTEASQLGYFSVNDITVIWEPIPPRKLCKYVPRFRGEVSYVKYKHGDYNIPVNSSSEIEDYTLFLIADQYGALFNVDSSQKVKDMSKFSCMPHKANNRTSLYQTGSDQMIMVTVVDDGNPDNLEKSHMPKEMRHVGIEEQVHGAYSQINYDPSANRVMSVQHDNQVTATKPDIKGDPKQVLDLKKYFNTVKTINGNDSSSTRPFKFKPSANEVFSYIQYQRAETQKHNLHVRAMQSCFINQIDWDMYMQLLDIDPSRAISNRLNVAVEASLGGNGFYNVKRCELAVNTIVVPTMKTNSDEKVTVNNEAFTVKQIVLHMGVRPDPEKCFAMPLVIFTSPSTGIQVVGQLTLNGVINTHKLSYLEACGRNKAHVFMINDYGHFFYDYVKNFTESADVVRNVTDRFLRASNPTTSLASGESMTSQQFKNYSLSKIHTLTVIQPANLKETEFHHYPTGLFRNDIYSLAEHQSASLGLMKLMEEQNFERFSTREFSAEWHEERDSADTGLFAGAANFVEGAGDFFMKVGEGGGSLLYGLGGGIGQAVSGVGKGVGKAGKGIFDGIGDALSNSFLTLGVPLIAVAVIAIVCVIFYKLLTGRNTPPSPEEQPPPKYQQQ